MQPLPNDIVLRPRFQLELPTHKSVALKEFEKAEKPPFLVKRVDDHVFIKFNKNQVHFWSPQLHLEIVDVDDHNSRLHGLFGPNPTLWTFFMFLHFGVGTLFIIFGIWAYSYASLGRPYGFQLGVTILMVALWFLLYVFGRAGKHRGKPQMRTLYQFMMETLTE